MRKRNKRLFLLSFVVVFLISLGTSAWAAPRHTFVLANDASTDTVTHLMTARLAELLEEKSGGAFATEVYPGGQMGSDVMLTQACQAGDIAFVLQTTAPQANYVRKLYVLDLPNMFPDVAVARAAMDRFVPMIDAEYERAGFKLMGYADQHFRVMTCNKKIESVDDFKDVRIRTMQNKYHLSYWRDLGAIPLPLPYSELSFSLDRGLVEAQENPIEVVVGGGFYKQQKYVVRTNHIFHNIAVIMSKTIYETLSAEDRRIVEEAARETIEWGRRQADEREAARIETIKAQGTEIIDLTPEMREEIIRRTQNTYGHIRDEIGADAVDAMLAEIKAAEGAN